MGEERLPGGFVLHTCPEVFPLGQDSVLLSDFAACPRRAKALDLGSGAGVLALLLLAKAPECHVTALEREEAALTLLARNQDANGLSDRIRILKGDVREHRALLPHGAFDVVICNPPYFDPAAGKAHSSLSAARQQDCGITEFLRAAAFSLRQGGKAAFVYRPERLCALLAAFAEVRLTPKRLRFVQQRMDSAPSAVLVEGMKGAKEGLRVLPPLLVEGPLGGFSDEYKKIYHKDI